MTGGDTMPGYLLVMRRYPAVTVLQAGPARSARSARTVDCGVPASETRVQVALADRSCSGVLAPLLSPPQPRLPHFHDLLSE